MMPLKPILQIKKSSSNSKRALVTPIALLTLAALRQDVVGPAIISRALLTYPLVFMSLMAFYIVGYMEAFGNRFLLGYAEISSLNVNPAAAVIDAKIFRAYVGLTFLFAAILANRMILIVLLALTLMGLIQILPDVVSLPYFKISDSYPQKAHDIMTAKIIAVSLAVRIIAFSSVLWALYVVLSYHWRYHRQAGYKNGSLT